MKKKILLILIIILIFCFSIFKSITLYLNKIERRPYYSFGRDNIPSIYNIVGKRELNRVSSSKSNGIHKQKFEYYNIDNVTSDLNEYVYTLKEKYNFIYTSDIDLSKKENQIELSKSSIDNDYIIIMKINYSENNYQIEISKGKGKIDLYQ